ncbi:MAG: hypothetical protein ACRYHQ_41325 [Janthinobacterium lividum]
MTTANYDDMPRKPFTVIDRLGRMVVREDGFALDGDTIWTSLLLKDGQAAADTVYITDASIQAAGARILGETWDVADFVGLNGDAARHAIVRRKLGAAADNRSVQFLDAAWRTLADDNLGAGKASSAALDPADAEETALQAARERLAGHRAAQSHILSKRWMSPEDRAAKSRDAGMTYEERMARRSGAPRSFTRKTS